MTQSEYARHRGVHPAAVCRAIAAGRVTPTIIGQRKLIDAAAADAQWLARSRRRLPNVTRDGAGAAAELAGAGSQPPQADSQPAERPQPGLALAGGDEVIWAIRVRREKTEADLAELRLAEQQGRLVKAADVQAALARRAVALREALLQLPSRLAPVLAAEPDAAVVHELLQAELRRALEQFVGGE